MCMPYQTKPTHFSCHCKTNLLSSFTFVFSSPRGHYRHFPSFQISNQLPTQAELTKEKEKEKEKEKKKRASKCIVRQLIPTRSALYIIFILYNKLFIIFLFHWWHSILISPRTPILSLLF